MKRLYYIRHGETKMNRSGHYSGTSETKLTPKGRAQAKAAGQLAKNLNIDYIVASPLSRAQATAKIIAKEIGYPVAKIHTNALFIERHFGAMEGLPWEPDLDIDGIADVESKHELLSRAKEALAFLHTLPYDNVLVVAHGTFGRALRSHIKPDMVYTNVDPTKPSPDRLPNAEIVCWIE